MYLCIFHDYSLRVNFNIRNSRKNVVWTFFKALIFIVQFSYKYLSNLLLHALCLTELASLYIISAPSLSLFVSAA